MMQNGNTKEKAKLDVSGNGLWSPLEKICVDVRMMHPNSPSHINKKVDQLYITHEREKKRLYDERVIQIEKGSFTPLVSSTSGGMANEAVRFHKRLAALISEKKSENYAEVMSYIRTRLRFCLLKSTLIAIRGVRGEKSREYTSPISTLSFNKYFPRWSEQHEEMFFRDLFGKPKVRSIWDENVYIYFTVLMPNFNLFSTSISKFCWKHVKIGHKNGKIDVNIFIPAYSNFRLTEQVPKIIFLRTFRISEENT